MRTQWEEEGEGEGEGEGKREILTMLDIVQPYALDDGHLIQRDGAKERADSLLQLGDGILSEWVALDDENLGCLWFDGVHGRCATAARPRRGDHRSQLSKVRLTVFGGDETD